MKRFLTILSCMLLLLMHCQKVSALNGFVVDHMSVEWIIEDNGFMRVYETYTVKGNGPIDKEFVIYISTNKKISWEDAKEEVYVPVTNVHVVSDHKYRLKQNNDGYEIWFDKSYQNEEYKISYLVKMDPMVHNGLYYMFYDMAGKRVDSYIAAMSFKITLPKTCKDNISIRIPNYEDKEDKGIVTYSMNHNVINGSYENMTSFANVQVLFEVDEDYFYGVNSDVFNYITLGVCFIVLLLVIIWFQRKGRQKAIEEIVDRNIINELTSMEVGYIHKGYSDARGVVSLFIQWAQKGYIQLEYIKNSKNIIFHKLEELPPTTKEYEKDLFKAMFVHGNDVRMKTLLSIFAKEVKATQKQMEKSFKHSSNKTKLSILDKIGFSCLGSLPIILVIGTQVFIHTLSVYKLMSIVGIYFVIMTIFIVYMLYISSKNIKKVRLISLFIFAMGLFYGIYQNYSTYVSWDIIGMAVMITLMLVYTVSTIKVRNDYADYLLDSSKGLYSYIKQADSFDKMNAKNIEELLPYAYALNLENELLEYIDTLDWLKDNGTSSIEILEILTHHIFKNIVDNRYI